DAHPDGDLVRGQDFLAFDRQLSAAHVHEHDFDMRRAAEPGLGRQLVPARFQDVLQYAVFIPHATMRWFDNDFLIHSSTREGKTERPRKAIDPGDARSRFGKSELSSVARRRRHHWSRLP